MIFGLVIFLFNFKDQNQTTESLVHSLWWGHGSLDGKTSNVLPALLEQGDKVVDSQHDVSNKLILSHTNVADSNTQAKLLLKLELDGGLDVIHLVGEIFVVGDGGWEFTSCRPLVLFPYHLKKFKKVVTHPWRDRDPRDGESVGQGRRKQGKRRTCERAS